MLILIISSQQAQLDPGNSEFQRRFHVGQDHILMDVFVLVRLVSGRTSRIDQQGFLLSV